MDSQFLKFWGEFLLKAAEGKRQVEELPRWMQAGFPPMGGLAALFRSCYGLPESTSDANGELWRKTTADFRAALEAYSPLWGWVTLDRHQKLQRKTERLEATVAEQARLIKQYETLLENRDMGHMSMLTRFQNVVDDQSQAFEKLVKALAPQPETPKGSDD